MLTGDTWKVTGLSGFIAGELVGGRVCQEGQVTGAWPSRVGYFSLSPPQLLSAPLPPFFSVMLSYLEVSGIQTETSENCGPT